MSTVTPKTDSEIEGMREAGRLAAEVLDMIAPQVEVGMTTGELDRICHDHIVNVQKAIPAPLNYKGFPKSICTSVNEVICHGIPSDNKKLRNGDIINIDVTVIKDGWHGDTSIMVGVGEVAPHAERLVRITQECLYQALALVKPDATLGDLGHVIQQHAEANYYSVVREYCGHGIGKV
ncbi:MAG: type I methionyl aminopeptidase, partial [Halieaceae bacterium]